VGGIIVDVETGVGVGTDATGTDVAAGVQEARINTASETTIRVLFFICICCYRMNHPNQGVGVTVGSVWQSLL